jgi:hypothetical protein
VRRGCISQGTIQCDSCHQTIPYAQRYLSVEEKDKAENEGGEAKHYCVECSFKKGYVEYREEKGKKIATFFTEGKKLPQS